MQFFKRLEIHGFKSFANKTVIEFQPGVTVVVGPNGCGKSNVFDAIRWVLGEQSAKSLRGSRMGDVIFNGSGGQKALGMAKVELILNNKDRTLPIEFDEVSIARRLFRTGESEYHLNRSQARLKDITSLFMDTGIGTDSYSVMEQGKVDAIVNAKSMERRAIFDEAAGISKYKARKEEALNKLRRTDDDLLRLADLINEVRRQSNSLRRQATKAERYKALTAELRALEMELLVRRYFQFRESGAAGEMAHRALAEKVAAMKAELAQIQEEQLNRQISAEELAAVLEATQGAHLELNRELQEVTSRIRLLEERSGDSGERRAQIEAQIAEYEQHARELESGRTQLEADIVEQEAALEKLRQDHEACKALYESLKTDGDSRVAEMARLRQEITARTRQRHEDENRMRVARAMEEKLLDELSKGDSELSLLREQVDSLTAERDERQEEAKAAEVRRQEAAAALAQAKDTLWAKETQYSGVSHELESARRAAHETQSRHDALADLQESFEGYYRGVKEVMLAGKRGHLSGLVGVVSTLIEAKKEHELAIEVALGGQAQDIVVETADHGKKAIRFLKESRVGRATFLPLDLIEGRENRHELQRCLSEPGVIGFATELVKYDPRLRKIVQYLLGNVIVVQNLDVAVALERRGVRTKFVTLDGEMVSAQGAMTGGSIKAAGLLNRTREVKELASRLKELRKKEADLTQQAVTLKEELARLREQREAAVRAAQQSEIDAARTKKDAEVAEHRLADKLTALRRLEERRGGVEGEIESHRRVQEEAGRKVDELARLISDLEEQLAGVEATATAKQAEVAEASRNLHELQVALSTGTERLNNLRERLGAGAREAIRLSNMVAERRRDIERLETQAAEAAAELEGLRQKLAGLEEKQKELSGQITAENQKKESIQLDLKKLAERAHVIQRDLNEAQNELHEAELKKTESSVQLENLAVQAMEKFAMPLAEVICWVAGADEDRQVVEQLQEERRKEAEAQRLAEEKAASLPEAMRELQPGGEAGTPEANGTGSAATAEGSVDVEGTESQPAPDAQDGEEGSAQESEAVAGEETTEETGPKFDPDHWLQLMPAEVLAGLRAVEEIASRVNEVRGEIDGLGPVHIGAIDEYAEANARLEFLSSQEKDLNDAKRQLTETIARIDETTKDLFTKAFTEIRANFEQVYRRLFGGGRADLLLTEENGVLESGIDIVAQPPGKKPQHISLLSGGEKALTAVALLFAIFMRKPSPFCILDEIDAPLDDKNVERFKELVREFAQTTQFIVITHNKVTMELANTIYGVTMQEPGVSRVVSLKLDDIDDSGDIRAEAKKRAQKESRAEEQASAEAPEPAAVEQEAVPV